ncbi:inorganic phosphate transporter [Ectobacillus ponti]|uniref:Anion permease n=1 Tax=Ectobacillus ponti TaxID=2961894 RepID=A0AA42BPE4_9BACI|nr:inorganic phosphate transporter [Ectobacillus ponti]MCP8968667.1 anion permease [Ectobacillus ponti]
MILAFLVAFFFAMNIGASGAAASMGVAYGSGAIKRRWVALVICAVAIVGGSVFGGQKVVKTISSGLIPEQVFTVQVAMLALLAATLSLFIANVLGIPLSTSEITIGAVAGVGIAYHVLYIKQLLFIIMFWLITPVVAFTLTFVIGKLIHRVKSKYPDLENGKWRPLFIFLVILTGFFEAYSAGMKNVANAIAPLVGAHLLTIDTALLLGGLFVALGAILLGRRVLETNGKKITKVSLLEGISISATSSTLVISAALFGIPLPIAQITTSSIVGIGSAQEGWKVFQKGIVTQMLKVWFVAPFISMLLAYSFIKMLQSDGYAIFMVAAGVLATLGVISLLKDTKQKKHVGGISQ